MKPEYFIKKFKAGDKVRIYWHHPVGFCFDKYHDRKAIVKDSGKPLNRSIYPTIYIPEYDMITCWDQQFMKLMCRKCGNDLVTQDWDLCYLCYCNEIGVGPEGH